MATEAIGYGALLKRNRVFRRLWYGQVISQLGDWFDTIALYTLLLRLTGSGQAIGTLIVAQFLPQTLVGIWGGVLIDRLPRKWMLIGTDIGRGLLVLLFLLVRDPSQIWIIYVVMILKVTLTALFEPARSAVIPVVTKPDELIAANGIASATWSAMLAIGAAIGGFVTGTLGITTALLIDSGSFLLSALLIATIPINEAHLQGSNRSSGLDDLREGMRYLWSQRDIAIYALVKALWSFAGSVLLLLTLFGQQIFPLGVDGAISIGLLYAARGVGAGVGPLIVGRLGGSSVRFLRRSIGPAFLVSAIGYAAFAGAPTLLLAGLAAMFAHLGGGAQWVSSTVLLQMDVPNRLQGRVFAVELALLTLTTALSSYLLGIVADAGWSPRLLALIVAGSFVPSGLVLTWRLWREPGAATQPTIAVAESVIER